ERLGADAQRPGLDLAVGQELEAGQPAVGGDVLVLLADRLAEAVDLDVAGLLRQVARVDQVLLVGVQRLEQRGREAARRAQPGAAAGQRDAERAARDDHTALRAARPANGTAPPRADRA